MLGTFLCDLNFIISTFSKMVISFQLSLLQPLYNRGTVKPELTATSEQRQLPTTASLSPVKSNSIAILIEKPLYSGHLSTTASILGSQGWLL